jgi:PST family polysaccharide transporter
MSTERRMLRGSLITYGAFVLSKLAVFGSTVVLARLLVPNQFGIVGYALLVLGFLYVLKNFGMGTALVYGQDLDDDRASLLFFVALFASLVSVAVAWVSAPAIAGFFHDHRIVTVTRVLSFSLVLTALGELHNAQLQKRLRFGRRAVPQVVSAGVKGVAAIAFAAAGFGYWSLVWGQLLGDATFAVTCWLLFPWVPRLRSRLSAVSHLLRFGMHVAVLEVVALFLLNVDNIVVGRVRGTAALGMYDLAFTIPQMLMIGLAVAISQAVFPVMATAQGDRQTISEHYRTVLRYVALVLLPIAAGLSVVAPAFVHSFYGRAWWPMTTAARVLALYAAAFAIGWGTGDVHQAMGRPDRQWKLDLMHLALLTAAVVIGAHLGGITGVALAQLIVVLPALGVRLWVVHRVLGFPASVLGSAFLRPLLGSLAIYAACALLGVVGAHRLGPVALLACQVVVGVAVYGLVVWPTLVRERRRVAGPAPTPSLELAGVGNR